MGTGRAGPGPAGRTPRTRQLWIDCDADRLPGSARPASHRRGHPRKLMSQDERLCGGSPTFCHVASVHQFAATSTSVGYTLSHLRLRSQHFPAV